LVARGEQEAARLAHFAEAAGSPQTREFATAAAEQAMARHAYREAADQCARALRYAAEASLETRTALFELHATASQRCDHIEDAIVSRQQAVALSAASGDEMRKGANQSRLARHLWCAGQGREAEQAARAAVQLLERYPPGQELAMACSTLAHLCVLAFDDAGAREWGKRAQHLGAELGDANTLLDARITLAAAHARSDYAAGVEALEECVTEAQAADLHDHAGRALTHRARAALDEMRLDDADAQLARALAFTDTFDLHHHVPELVALRALVACHRGRWQEVVENAGVVLRRQDRVPPARITALTALGRMQARRGDAAAQQTLADALLLAERTAHLMQMAPVWAAQAGWELLQDRRDAAACIVARVLPLVEDRGTPWLRGEFRWLAREAGLPGPEVDGDVASPWGLQLRGSHEDAAAAWDDLGCPYEAAVARFHVGSVVQVQAAAQAATELQARPLLARCNAALRKLGVRAAPVPRGPRQSTRANPGGLTRREMEVLELLAVGLTNAGIAERLYLTTKTVSHHLSAIYTKLGASNRMEAVRLASEIAEISQNGHVLVETRGNFPMSGGRLL
jgi:DNA-binding CsgD family transcriptional regulator